MDSLETEELFDIARLRREKTEAATTAALDAMFPYYPSGYISNLWRRQGLFFASDTLALLVNELAISHEWGSNLRLLDVGAGPGFGTEFIGDLFSEKGPSGYQIECDAIDLGQTWARVYPFIHKHARLIVGDIFDMEKNSYDIVICSAVIEHLERSQAISFVEKMVSISKKTTIITCPWKEDPLNLSQTHVLSIDESFILQINPNEYRIYQSGGWTGECVGMIFRK